MKGLTTIINIILVIICAVLAVAIVLSIIRPMKIKEKIADRTEVVHDKLYEIRGAQEAVKSATGYFAKTFDSLETVVINDDFIKVNRTTSDTTRISILDSLYKGDVEKVKQLRYIPFSDGKEFKLEAGVLEIDSAVYIPTFQVLTMKEDFLSDLSKKHWYSDSEVDRRIKLGSMTAPIVSGNWE